MIIEATKYLPDLEEPFAVQSVFDDSALWRIISMRIPGLRQLLIKRAIIRGAIYIRPHKINPNKPKTYRDGIWQIRNLSQREDGVYGVVGFSKNRSPFAYLKHR